MSEVHLHDAYQLRKDVVVSVCLPDLPVSEEAFGTLRDLARRMDSVFQFREIIIVVNHLEHTKYLGLLSQIPDLRLFEASPGCQHYERRAIAAEEAIGDVVLIGSAEELSSLDVVALLRQAESTNSLVLATRSARRAMRTGLSSPMIALGRVAGFRVSLHDLQTVAMPRTILNYLLGHREPQLALRFPPREPHFDVTLHPVSANVAPHRTLRQISRRLQLFQKLLISLAPTLLKLVSISSAVLALFGLGFALYLLVAWFVIDDLASGWLTTSAMLSLSATFLGLSILGLSLSLQQVLAQKNTRPWLFMPKEINQIDLFGKVASDLNVEVDNMRGPQPPGSV